MIEFTNADKIHFLEIFCWSGGAEAVRMHASSSELWSKGLKASARWLKATDCGVLVNGHSTVRDL